MTKVVNKRRAPYDVYIGRGSPWGNPFAICQEAGITREEVIKDFKDYFYDRLKTDDEFLKQTLTLKDKTLGCFCKPLACHGDIIVDFVEEFHNSRLV